MRRIRLFGLTLLALFTFGVVVAATASAEEGNVAPGLLFLAGEEGPVSVTGKGGKATLNSAAGSIVCESTETKSDTEGQEAGKHIELIRIHIHFLGCKNGKLACNSEENGKADPKEQILILIDLHFVNWLNTETKKLEAGLEFIILNNKLENPLTIKCGIGLVEVRGSVGGLLKVASLTADITSGTVVLPISSTLVCDPLGVNFELCKKILEKPLEANFAGKFESATETAESSFELGKMVVVDD